MYVAFTSAPSGVPAPAPTATTRAPSVAPSSTQAPSVTTCHYGSGMAWIERVVASDVASASYVWAVDLDQDGDVDVLGTSLHDDTVAWYENDGEESFTKHVLATDAASASFAGYHDFNLDGALDVVACSWGDNSTRVFFNYGDGTMRFEELVVDSTSGYVGIYNYDVDGDGDEDIIGVSFALRSIYWYKYSLVTTDDDQLGTTYTPSYEKLLISDGLAGPWFATPCDVDGDTDVDIVVATGYDFSITWLENDGNQDFSVRNVVDTELVQPRMVAAGARVRAFDGSSTRVVSDHTCQSTPSSP